MCVLNTEQSTLEAIVYVWRSSFKCLGGFNVFNVIQAIFKTCFSSAGRSHFEKFFTNIVLEDDGSFILDDEVLEILSSEKFLLMLLGDSEKWSPRIDLHITQVYR